MIYLRASAEELDLLTLDPDAVAFREEDFGNQLTAVAIVTDNKKRFQKFKLI